MDWETALLWHRSIFPSPNSHDFGREGMMDLVYLGLTVVFLLATYGLVVLCERLMEDKP
jgi:hypothetical protein